MIAIHAQAILASFQDRNNDASHFDRPLPPENVKGLVEYLPSINKIIQPYSSAKGKPAEDQFLYYSRISERIRHKNRALNMWDYERLILDHFPTVYKAKCISERKIDKKGQVKIVVIPDIRGKTPFFPVEPKVPAATLANILDFLKESSSMWAKIEVHNPVFVQVRARFSVRFRPGFSPGYYQAQLNDEIKRFLSPWAYEEGADIVLGGRIYPNALVNFIEKREYVDYVTNMKLFQKTGEAHFKDVRVIPNSENAATATEPDMVLVTAQDHVIDLISGDGYVPDDFEGIGFMKVGLDFLIPQN